MKVDSMLPHTMLTFGGQDVQFHQSYHHHIIQDGEDEDIQMDESVGNSKAEMRKNNKKPIMEKKRRARINNCLNDLKGILLEAMKKDPARHSKLEKADILELTVRHLQNVQRNQLAIAMATDPTVLHRFKNGFSECATEVGRYMGKLDGVDPGVRQRLSGHLGTCINGLQQVGPFGGGPPRYSTLSGIPFIPPSSISAPTGTVIPDTQRPAPIHAPITRPAPTGDLNNNNSFQPNPPLTIAPIPIIPFEVISRPTPSVNSSAFTPVARRPPTPQESPSLMSPPSSNDNPNVSVSLSSGSDSSCAGSTPSAPVGLSPIDFSLKVKDKDRTVRVLKVEPMMMYDDLNTTMNKGGSMWRPW